MRALQDRLLQHMVQLCYDHHPFYAKLMRREGLRPDDIRSCDDLVRLPPSSKTDYLADPDAFRLTPGALPGHEGTLWKIVYTTGTTSGRPAPIFVTAHDHFAYQYLFKDRQDLIGLKDTDRIANLFPMTAFPMGAYSRAADEAGAVGAAIMFGHTGRTDMAFPVNRSLDEAVAAVARHRVTVVWGVAGFVRRVLIRAKENSADFSSVRMVMTTGEAASAAMREDFRRRMRELGCADTVIVNRYGSTEQGGTMIECRDGSGFHSAAPDQLFHEIVDDQTGQRLADGEARHARRDPSQSPRNGVSALQGRRCRGARPQRLSALRADLGSPILHAGAHRRHREDPRRAGQSRCRSRKTFDRMPGVDEYQIVVTREDLSDPFSTDKLMIRLAMERTSEAGIAEMVSEDVRRLTNLRPVVEIASRDEIFDPTSAVKPQRIVDRRLSG